MAAAQAVGLFLKVNKVDTNSFRASSSSDVLVELGSISSPVKMASVSKTIGFILLSISFLILIEAQDPLDLVESPQCQNVNRDMSWFRQNARALLFMEHLQRRAMEENLYDWSKMSSSEPYRARLRSLERQFVMPEEIPDDCYDQMPIPAKISQRIAFLEDRLEGCASSIPQSPCSSYDPAVREVGGGGLVLRRLSMMQAELMRQRNVIRMMRMRMITINQQCEGKSLSSYFKFVN